MAKVKLPDISPHAFEHPLDRTALSGLQKVPGIDWVIRKFLAAIGEKRVRLLLLGSAVRVSQRQFPGIQRAYEEACAILDITEPPELFISQSPDANAFAIGVDKPVIVVYSGLVDLLGDEELQCVLGHELGHVLCGHALYTTVMLVLINLGDYFVGLPGGRYAVWAIVAALLEWSRKAELSADRAGLLVSQNPRVSYRVDMKLAGGKKADEMSVDEFVAQADEYQSAGDVVDGVLKLSLILKQTHPLPVLRVAELKRWIDGGEYERILGGDYEKRSGGEPEASWVDSLKATRDDYKESFLESKDPLMAGLRQLGDGAAATGAEVVSFFRRTFGIKPGDGEGAPDAPAAGDESGPDPDPDPDPDEKPGEKPGEK